MPEFRRFLGKLLGLYAVLGVVCAGVAALFGSTILTVAFDSGYAAHAGILTLIMVAMAIQFMTGILDLAMIALRRRILPAWLSAVSLALLSVCCWQWVPEYGFTGAAAAMIVSRLPRPLILGCVVFRATGPVEEQRDDHQADETDRPEPTRSLRDAA